MAQVTKGIYPLRSWVCQTCTGNPSRPVIHGPLDTTCISGEKNPSFSLSGFQKQRICGGCIVLYDLDTWISCPMCSGGQPQTATGSGILNSNGPNQQNNGNLGTWRCSGCGGLNSFARASCFNCGNNLVTIPAQSYPTTTASATPTPLPQTQAAIANLDEWTTWVCNHCSERTDNNYDYCKNCNKDRDWKCQRCGAYTPLKKSKIKCRVCFTRFDDDSWEK